MDALYIRSRVWVLPRYTASVSPLTGSVLNILRTQENNDKLALRIMGPKSKKARDRWFSANVLIIDEGPLETR